MVMHPLGCVGLFGHFCVSFADGGGHSSISCILQFITLFLTLSRKIERTQNMGCRVVGDTVFCGGCSSDSVWLCYVGGVGEAGSVL